MNNKKNTLFLLMLFTIIFTSCKKELLTGSGSITNQDRAVANFTKVTIVGSVDVEITQDATFKVVASDYENLVNEIETIVIGDELKIGFKNNISVLKSKSKVTINMPLLIALKTEGSGDFLVNGTFNLPTTFQATINGSGDMQLNNLTLNNAVIFINGSGDINISNSSCNTITMSVQGSGDINAYGLLANSNEVNINGSGDVKTNVVTNLKVKIDGSGDVYYKGSPILNKVISGSGRVIKVL
jgi:Putative auto-transporter adhesin, head GIN domain